MNARNLFYNTTKADRILFIALILASLSGMFFARHAVSEQQMVHIDVNGKPVYVLPLDVNKVVSVDGLIGDSTIEIKDRKVRILESPCNNKLCVRQGWTDHGSIICLPNRVIVTIEGPKEHTQSLDAITG